MARTAFPLKWRRNQTAAVLAAAAALLAGLGLYGWLAGARRLTVLSQDSVAMAPVSCVLLLALGLVVAWAEAWVRERTARRTARLFGLIVACAGVAFAVFAVLDVRVASSGPSSGQWGDVVEDSGGALSIAYLMCLIALGLSIYLRFGRRRSARTLEYCSGLAVVPAGTGLLVALRHLFGPHSSVGLAYAPMALGSALCFFALGGAVLVSSGTTLWRHHSPSRHGLHAFLWTLALPAACIAMLAVGYSVDHLPGIWRHLPAFWPAYAETTAVAVVGLVAWQWASARRALIDLDRAASRARRTDSRLRDLFESAPVPIWELDLSRVRRAVEGMRTSGVASIGAHLERNPGEMAALLQQVRVIDTNGESQRTLGLRGSDGPTAGMFVEDTWRAMREVIDAFARGERHWETETVLRVAGGDEQVVLARVSIVHGCEATWERVIAAFPVITQQKQVEAELRMRDRAASTLIGASDASMFGEVLALVLDALASPRGGFGWLSPEGDLVLAAMTGTPPAEAADRGGLPVAPRSAVGGAWRRALETAASVIDNEPHHVPALGRALTRTLVTPLAHAGTVVGLLSVSCRETDYTARDQACLEAIAAMVAPVLHARLERDARRAERERIAAELMASEQRFRMLFEDAPVAFQSLSEDGAVLDVNRSWEDLLGCPREEAYGRPFISFVDPADRDMVEARLPGLAEAGAAHEMEVRLVRRDGATLLASVEGASGFDAVGGSRRMHCVVRDVTKQRHAEAQLQHSRALLLGVTEGATDAVYVKDLRGRYLMVNTAAAERLGLPSGEILGRTDAELRPAGAAIADGADEMVPEMREETVVVAGAERTYLTATGPVRDGAGAVMGSFGIARDITARKAMEDAVVRERNRARMYLDAAAVMMVAIDLEGRIVLSNRRGCRMLGWEEHELLGLDWFTHCVPPHLREERRAAFAAIVSGAAEREAGADREILTRDGESRLVAVQATRLYDDAGELSGFLLSGEDVTERRKMEAHLQQVQRLEAVGTLASGVGHEINNPVNGIINYAQVILDTPDASADLRDIALEIQGEGERIAAIVRSLLDFARQENQAHSTARVPDLIEGAIALVAANLRRDQIRLQVEIEEGLPGVKCRTQQIQQVVLNLINNARAALNERFPSHDPDKVLEVRVFVIDHDARRWVRVQVRDNGSGMPPSVATRIFDPFFTTGTRDQSSGLGLAVSYGIVQAHRGALTVESAVGAGTTFTLDLLVDNGWLMPSPTA